MSQGVFAFGGALVGFLIYVALVRSGAIEVQYFSPWPRLFLVACVLGGAGIHSLIERWVTRRLEARRAADRLSQRPQPPRL